MKFKTADKKMKEGKIVCNDFEIGKKYFYKYNNYFCFFEERGINLSLTVLPEIPKRLHRNDWGICGEQIVNRQELKIEMRKD